VCTALGINFQSEEYKRSGVTKAALFEKTMIPHLDAAYNLARWITRSDHDAEDVVQEAYLRAFRYFDSFTGGDGRTWMLAIVRNTCVTWYRKQKNSSAVAFDERMHSAEMERATPEKALLQKSSLSSLRDCIEALPLEYRDTLIMRELEELSYRAIADVTALPIGTVMSRLSRARRRLDDCMAAKGEQV
jgi:RNA polymerase sigma-70 factor, ECF subfamily